MKRLEDGTKRVFQQKIGTDHLSLSLPVKATMRTADGVQEYEGRLESIGGERARICFDRPVDQGTEITVVVEFKDKQNREIAFRYDAEVISPNSSLRYEVDVTLREGVGISGKDARDILSDLFAEHGCDPLDC